MNLQKVVILILLCFLSQLKAEEKGHYHNLNKALQNPMDVRTLDLSKNQLTTLPKEIRKLQKLNTLNLDDIPALKSQEKRFRNYFPKQVFTLSK
ncbi:leucine rich repeat protein [Leptospira kirschneri str. H1]|uniref:Leucine rich repeat protein n=1 Tax=Leptospira kirschneri str. H1 TaxID=1049966 RepID=A0A0E2B148_9LEPT|nr:leucine rich repeat protein [Leptospira kirschneri str. H1]